MSTPGGSTIPPEQLKARYIGTGKHISSRGFVSFYGNILLCSSGSIFDIVGHADISKQ